MRRVLTMLATLGLVAGLAAPASAAPPTKSIVLPGATGVEPITAGDGDTFYAGDPFAGGIYRGDIRRGTAELFIKPPAGTKSVGMDYDHRDGLLFVAGGDKGKAYVYNVRTRKLVASYDFGDPNQSFINGVTVTPYGVWFDDSLLPQLYFVPILFGVLGTPRTLPLSGPAASPAGTFANNDMTSTPSGRTLLIAPQNLGKLITIDTATGASRIVADVDVPSTNGVLLQGHEFWATQLTNRISRWRLSDDLSSGTLEQVITDPLFHVPLTSVRFGDRLAVTNSHYDTDYPPTSPTYEVLVLPA
jgi:hypothetical protein